MRRADPRPDRALLLVAVTLVLLVVSATTAAAAGDCQAGSVIRGGGGEAGAECSDTGRESTEPVGNGGGALCTEERAADPDAWWISYDIPDGVIPGEAGSDTSHRRLDLP